MLEVLAVSAPIYLLIALGWVAVRSGYVERADIAPLGRFAVNLCLPALLIHALVSRPLVSVLVPGFVAAYAAGSMAAWTLGWAWWRRLRGQPAADSAILAMGMCSSNSGFIGYPIVSQLLGPTAAVALALIMLVENLLVVPWSLTAAERGQLGTRSFASALRILRGVVRHPLVVGMAVGLLLALLQLPLPSPVLRGLQLLGGAAAPVALFVIGGTLVGLKPDGLGAEVAVIALGKLLLHPLLVLAALLALQHVQPAVDRPLLAAGVLYACVPMLSIFPLLAQRFGLDKRCAAALLVTTALAFFTINGWLWAVRHGLGWVGP